MLCGKVRLLVPGTRTSIVVIVVESEKATGDGPNRKMDRTKQTANLFFQLFFFMLRNSFLRPIYFIVSPLRKTKVWQHVENPRYLCRANTARGLNTLSPMHAAAGAAGAEKGQRLEEGQ